MQTHPGRLDGHRLEHLSEPGQRSAATELDIRDLVVASALEADELALAKPPADRLLANPKYRGNVFDVAAPAGPLEKLVLVIDAAGMCLVDRVARTPRQHLGDRQRR